MDLKNISIEEKKQVIELHLNMLKGILEDTGMVIAFDKKDNDLVFVDKELYESGKVEGFKTNLSELNY